MFIIYKRFYFDLNDNKNEYQLIFCFNKIKFILEFALKSVMPILNSTKILDKMHYVSIFYMSFSTICTI